MPDPISPASPANHTIDLEPIVVTGTLRKPEAPVPLPYGDIALQCFDEVALSAAAVLSASAVAPPVAILSVVGTSAAVGVCVGNTINQSEDAAAIRRAVQDCIDAGGTPIGPVENTLTCGGLE